MALDQVRDFHTTMMQRAQAGDVSVQVPPVPIATKQIIGNNLLTTVGVGPLAGYTQYYDLNLVNFDYRTWHEYEWENWAIVDALIHTAFRGVENLTVWQPETNYLPGDVVVSVETGLAYECLGAHLSDPDTITNDIAKGYWTETVVGAGYTKDESDALFVDVAGDTMTGFLTLNADPTAVKHAATKQYVDKRVAKTGDTMSGFLTLHANPTAVMHATPKQYVDTFMPKAGGAFTGAVSFAGDTTFTGKATFLDTSFPTPDDDDDAATKKYVDDAIAGGSGSTPYVKRTGDTMTGPLLVIGDSLAPSASVLPSIYAQRSSTAAQYIGLDGGDAAAVYIIANTAIASGKDVVFENLAGVDRDYVFRVDGVIRGVVEAPDTAANLTDTFITRRKGDARYLQQAGGTVTGILLLESGSPQVQFHETDATGTAGNYRFSGLATGSFYFQRSDDATFATQETLWRYSYNPGKFEYFKPIEITGYLTTTTSASIGTSLVVGTSVESGGGFFVNDDTDPNLQLRNAAKQLGTSFYYHGDGVTYLRSYESFASGSYTAYAFRYGGATSAGDVLRMAEGDARYVNTGSIGTLDELRLVSSTPYVMFNQTDVATNIAWWSIGSSGSNFAINPRDSTGASLSGSGGFNISRDAGGIVDVTFTTGPATGNTASPATNSVITRERGDARYALDGSYAQYTTSSSSSLTNFPIGSIVLVRTNNVEAISRNGTTTINIYDNNAQQYVRSNVTGAGAALSGTWRAKGSFTVEGGNEGEATLMQRVA